MSPSLPTFPPNPRFSTSWVMIQFQEASQAFTSRRGGCMFGSLWPTGWGLGLWVLPSLSTWQNVREDAVLLETPLQMRSGTRKPESRTRSEHRWADALEHSCSRFQWLTHTHHPPATASAMSYTSHNATTSHTGFHIHLSGLVLEAWHLSNKVFNHSLNCWNSPFCSLAFLKLFQISAWLVALERV